MAERSSTSNGMFWAFVWWAAALVAAILVYLVLSHFISDDPAAGIVFSGATFVVVGLLLAYLGPGQEAVPAIHEAPVHHHRPHTPAAPVSAPQPAAVPVAPVAPVADFSEPAEPAPPPAVGPGSPISERVRDAARAAGEAARAALADEAPAAAAERPADLSEAGVDAGRASENPDNLMRLKGVGPKFAELLNANGIYRFSQIAAWGPDDIARIEGEIEGFSGRIERDDWVGQAKVLAAGGETEHSQRVDRGEST